MMIRVIDDMDFDEIRRTSWCGAVATVNRITEEGKEDEFCNLIEECYPEGIDRTSLNDILWFEEDWIFEMLGIKDDEEEEESGDDENA